MKNIYITREKKLEEVSFIEEGCWVKLVNPTEQEIEEVALELSTDKDFLRSALDEEERPRIDHDIESKDMLIIVDIPISELENSKGYSTLPMSIIFTEKAIITICLKESIILDNFINGNIKSFFSYKKSRFILQMLYRNATLFLYYLKQIDKQSEMVKQKIHKSMRNEEIIELLDLETSLVYFNTSLKANELIMEKLLRYEFIKKYPEDRELLEDTIIENKQAIEMARIYGDILAGTMDAYSSIISNNLNIVMKFLTSITIIMSIPNMIFGFFGMNVLFPFNPDNAIVVLVIFLSTIGICGLIAIFMAKRKMF